MYNDAPKKKYACRANEIIKRGKIAYLVTRNLPPETVIIDAEDIEKISMYSWSAHPHLSGIKIIKHRYRTVDGKWHSINLGHTLGYGHGWKHKNGNIYDFRKENMMKNDFSKYARKPKVVKE